MPTFRLHTAVRDETGQAIHPYTREALTDAQSAADAISWAKDYVAEFWGPMDLAWLSDQDGEIMWMLTTREADLASRSTAMNVLPS